ncbi:pulmonary surfactant-associated protein A-like [Macrotis lagotis]|uniref:pulmonary surfactant-associated protein A-like n=1 Tax=Macrotis lagotis TaxID=92651 RepID=UPI003D69E786
MYPFCPSFFHGALNVRRYGRVGPKGEKGEPGTSYLQGCPQEFGTPGNPGPQGLPGMKHMKGDPGGVSFLESHNSLTKELLALMSDLKIGTSEVESLGTKGKPPNSVVSNLQPSICMVISFKLGESFFATSGQSSNFLKNSLICQEMGGTVATPRNEEENAAIMKLMVKYNIYAFLGLMEGKIPGNFHYLDGTPVNYTNWYAGTPDGQGNENCVEMYTDGTWNDKYCSKSCLTICEF